MAVRILPEEEKQYAITQEIADIWTEYEALDRIRDGYIEHNKRFAKIKAVSVDAENTRNEFWASVRDIHPDIRGKNIHYEEGGLFVTVKP